MSKEKKRRFIWPGMGPGALYALLCAGCCAGVFCLYHVEAEAIAYAVLLCLLLGAGLLVGRGIHTARRIRLLRSAQSQLRAGEAPLPVPRTAEEAEYQALIRALYGELRGSEARYDRALQQMQDDYTLWAHQIKTPIAALWLLLDEGREEERIELQRIEGYVDVAMNVQRLARGSDLTVRECDLDALLRGLVRKYSRLFIRKRLYLRYEPLNRRVLTDEKWLTFLLEQVLVNALQYTREGGITIEMTGDTLCVADTGIGIAPEDLPRVFERGFTGYNGRAQQRSTGMGLYLCKRAADLLGHGLRIESAPGQGTRVLIDLSREVLRVD